MGTDTKKAIIGGLDLSIANLSEKNNPGLEVQQKNCGYLIKIVNEVFQLFFSVMS